MKISHLEKVFKNILRTHRTMQNFPKIPKIALIKSCDQAKDTKISNYESAILIFRKYVYFYVALPSRLTQRHCLRGSVFVREFRRKLEEFRRKLEGIFR